MLRPIVVGNVAVEVPVDGKAVGVLLNSSLIVLRKRVKSRS